MNKVVAIVGMAGSGKSTAADIFVENRFQYLRFGQVTMDELQRRGLSVNEENERQIREELRAQYGMEAYANLNLLKIEELHADGPVIIDGLYSWEEYLVLKRAFDKNLIVLAIYSSPETRYSRLEARKLDSADRAARFRPATREESTSRDAAEIENLHKAGPIAMADYTIVNESSPEEFRSRLLAFIQRVR